MRGFLVEALRDNQLARFALRFLILLRTKGAWRRTPGESWRYLLHGRQTSNFYYELKNTDEAVATVAELLAVPTGEVREFIRELRDDGWLRASLRAKLTAHPERDDEPHYGYRELHYAIVRVLRPATVAEIGTHDGVGSALLLRALQRNADEGAAGRLLAFDQGEGAAWAVDESLRPGMSLIVGDVSETVGPALAEHSCGFLIEDIGWAFEPKRPLFESALAYRRGKRLVIRAETDSRTTLRDFTAAHGGRYAEYRERPTGTFWPGHDNGLAVFEP